MRHCSIHNIDYFIDCGACTRNIPTKPLSMEFEYCPSCSGELDTGYECTKCGRDWQPWAQAGPLHEIITAVREVSDSEH